MSLKVQYPAYDVFYYKEVEAAKFVTFLWKISDNLRQDLLLWNLY